MSQGRYGCEKVRTLSYTAQQGERWERRGLLRSVIMFRQQWRPVIIQQGD